MSLSDIALLSAEVEDSFQRYDSLYRSSFNLFRQPLRTLQCNGSVVFRKANFEMGRSLKGRNTLKGNSHSENENLTNKDSVKYFVVRGNKPLSLIIKRIHPYARNQQDRKSNTKHKTNLKQIGNSENEKPNVLPTFDSEIYCSNKVSVVFENKSFNSENVNFKTEDNTGVNTGFDVRLDHSDRLSTSENDSSRSESINSELDNNITKENIFTTNINTLKDCSDRVSFDGSRNSEFNNGENNSDNSTTKSASTVNIKLDCNDRVSVYTDEFPSKYIDNVPGKDIVNQNSWNQDTVNNSVNVSESKDVDLQCFEDADSACSIDKIILAHNETSSDENSTSTVLSNNNKTCNDQSTCVVDVTNIPENVPSCKDENLQCDFESSFNKLENSDDSMCTVSPVNNETCANQNSWNENITNINFGNVNTELTNIDNDIGETCNVNVSFLSSYDESDSIPLDSNKIYSDNISGEGNVTNIYANTFESKSDDCVKSSEDVNFEEDNTVSKTECSVNINVAVNTDETFINSTPNSLHSEDNAMLSDSNEESNQNSWNQTTDLVNVPEYSNELLNFTRNSDKVCLENVLNECVPNVDVQQTFGSTSCTTVAPVDNSEICVNQDSWDEDIASDSTNTSECNNDLSNSTQNSDLSDCLTTTNNLSEPLVNVNVQESLVSSFVAPEVTEICTDQNSWDHNIAGAATGVTECINVLGSAGNPGIPENGFVEEAVTSIPFVNPTPVMPFAENICPVIPQPAINVCNTVMQPNINPLNIMSVPPVNYIPPVNCIYPAGVGCVYVQPQVSAMPFVNIAQPGNVWNTSFSSSTIVLQSSNNSGVLTGNRLTINSYVGNQTNVCFNSFSNVQQVPVNTLGQCSQDVTSINNSKIMQFPDFSLQPGLPTVGIAANAFCSSVGMQDNTVNLNGNFQNAYMGGGGYGGDFLEDDSATGVIITELSDENDELTEEINTPKDQEHITKDQSNSMSNSDTSVNDGTDEDEAPHSYKNVDRNQENGFSFSSQTSDVCNNTEQGSTNHVTLNEQSFTSNYDNTNDICGDTSSDRSHFSNLDDLYFYHSDESISDNEVNTVTGTGLTKTNNSNKSNKNFFLGDANFYHDTGTGTNKNDETPFDNLNSSQRKTDSTVSDCNKNDLSTSCTSDSKVYDEKSSLKNESVVVCVNNTVSPINDTSRGVKESLQEVQHSFLDKKLSEPLQGQSINNESIELSKLQYQLNGDSSVESLSNPGSFCLSKKQPHQNGVVNSTCKSSTEIFIDTSTSKQGEPSSLCLSLPDSTPVKEFSKYTGKNSCLNGLLVKPQELSSISEANISPLMNESLETKNACHLDKEDEYKQEFPEKQELTPSESHATTPFSIFSVRKLGCFSDINREKTNTAFNISEEHSKSDSASGFSYDNTNIVPSEDSNDTMGFLGFQEDSNNTKDPWDKFISNGIDNQFKRKHLTENSVSPDTVDRKNLDSSNSFLDIHEDYSSDPNSSDVPVYGQTKSASVSNGIPDFAISEDTVTSVLNDGFSDKEYQEHSPLLFFSDEEESCSFGSKPSSSTEEFGSSGNRSTSGQDNLKSFEKFRLRRLRKLLMGVPPPPSVTVPTLQISDAIELLKQSSAFNLPTECETSQGSTNNLTKLPKFTSSETYAKTTSWPESKSIFYHGISYNLGRESEEFEYLCQKMASRYVGKETTSSCIVVSKSPGSVVKRKKRRGFGHSPGSRLSYLARRRHTFSSANLLKDTNAKAGVAKRQIIVDAKKKDHKRTRNVADPGIDRKCLQTKVNTLKRALFKSPPGRNKPIPTKTSLNFDGANNGSHVGALKEIKNHLQNEELNVNGKRVLQHTDYAPPNKCRRNLFQASCGENKSNLQISTNQLNLIPAENNRVLSDKGKTDVTAAGDSVSSNRSASSYSTLTSHTGLNSTHKRKLLWAVAEALREVGIGMQHPNFRCHATALTNLCRGHVTDFLKTRREHTGQSTSDCMLAVARKYVVKVIDKSKQEAVT